MQLDPEELLELIDMHGRTIIESSMCDDCHAPMRDAMLLKLERMRELILMIPPDHTDVDVKVDHGDDGSVVIHMTKPKGTMQ